MLLLWVTSTHKGINLALFFPTESALQPAGLLHTRGIADQAFAHCPIFPTAASRRSLGRVSVPVWLIILSDQLPIAALVGRYPTNKLIGRGLILQREPKPPFSRKTYAVLARVSSGCPPLQGRFPRVTHRPPLYSHPKALSRSTCMC